MEYVSLEGLRTDGRRPNEHRFCACTFRNPISQSNGCSGSAEFKLGQTCCVAAVFGPMTSSAQNAVDPLAQEQLKVTVEITSAAFGTDALFAAPAGRKTSSISSKSDRKNKELALKFEQILSQCVDAKRFPRSEVYVSAATINDDGSASAALFNSIILALVDAGIPLLDVFVAMCATRLDGETLLDQNEVEERGRGAECFVVAETKERKKTDGLKGNIGFNAKNNDDAWNDDEIKRIVSYDIYGGKLAATAVDGALRACAKGCDDVAIVMRKAMKKRLAKLASTTKNM
jgi:exosome complex component RRP41